MIKTLKNRRGMTLIEIMIVLAILGSIMAILGNKFTGARDKAKIREAKIAMGEISKALSMYYNDCGKYPVGLENLEKADPSCSAWGPTAYMKKVPKDPWDRTFIYEASSGEFTLMSLGRDGAEGGSDFDADITLE